MKLPETINVGGVEWEVRRSDGGGGCFDACDHWVNIGTDMDDKTQWEVFIHEITEGIMADNLLRYRAPHTPPDNGDYMFVFDHKQFEVMVAKPLAALLWELLPWWE